MQNHALVFLLLFLVLLVAVPPLFAKVLAKFSRQAGEQKSAAMGPSLSAKAKRSTGGA